MQDRIEEIEDHARDLGDFISASPSSYHAAATAARRLSQRGYVRQREDEPWDASAGGHFLLRDGALIAWRIPERPARAFRIVGSHTDSPSLKIKPVAQSPAHGFARVNAEVYGGPLLSSWLNRDLGIAGHVADVDGGLHLFATGPAMVIPQLAPHLDREASLTIDRQQHTHPLRLAAERPIMEEIARAAGLDVEQIAGMDAYAYDTQAPARVGERFFASGRQDNLVSVHASMCALLGSEVSGTGSDAEGPGASGPCNTDANNAASPDIAVLAAFDHEEVGSATPTGAAGPLLERVLCRTAMALGASDDEYYRMLAASTCISADAGHSINPNYAAAHDPDQYPVAGAGPIIKLNANQRYASDARGQALWHRACTAAGQRTQTFVSNNSVPCGSTIGPITATRLGIDTVDVGIPLLSMHSIRETSAIGDSWALAQILKAYWRTG
ncbi:MAG: M18 family aminopeptidase [Actinomycetaceae bacterium]|nr:M18 family aminopeptidase [Actinomycetaceae bacterium]